MTTRDEMVKSLEITVREELDDPSNYTYWETLDVVDGKEYAVVVGRHDHGDELYMKLAYTQPENTDREYDIDWVMPYDEESGWVDDAEVLVSSSDEVAEIVDWMLGTYNDWMNGVYIG